MSANILKSIIIIFSTRTFNTGMHAYCVKEYGASEWVERNLVSLRWWQCGWYLMSLRPVDPHFGYNMIQLLSGSLLEFVLSYNTGLPLAMYPLHMTLAIYNVYHIFCKMKKSASYMHYVFPILRDKDTSERKWLSVCYDIIVIHNVFPSSLLFYYCDKILSGKGGWTPN